MDGGGALMNQSVHYADLVCWLCGQPEVLSAHCATVAHDIEVEDLALALLRFEDGALGMFEASTVAFPGFPTTLRVSGTEGTIVLENGALVAAALQDGDESVTEGDVSALGFPGGHRAQLADITSAIVEGRPQSVSGEDGYVLTWDPSGTTPANPDVITTKFARLTDKAGIPQVRFHDLRHAVATTLLGEGTDVATVAMRLGHASPVTTMRVYAHVLEANDRKAAGVMGALLASTKAE